MPYIARYGVILITPYLAVGSIFLKIKPTVALERYYEKQIEQHVENGHMLTFEELKRGF